METARDRSLRYRPMAWLLVVLICASGCTHATSYQWRTIPSKEFKAEISKAKESVAT